MFPQHFDGKRFHNPAGPPPRGWRDVLRWKLTAGESFVVLTNGQSVEID